MPELVSLLPLVAIIGLFWLLLIRPQAKRQRELRRMQDALSVGDEVMLASGIFGRLVSTEGDRLHLEVSAGVTLQVARGAVAQVVPPAADRGYEGESGPHGEEG
ncbi:preprotein translocase subunit YajC [Nocardioides sp. GCM10027113]|uniref:preprotein translocase subunit YajC n=1 Tax=unclassified Nocardioides TaxID=2615069 RepID=UPI00361C6A1E